MKALHLELLTNAGDVIATVRVDGVQAADVGETVQPGSTKSEDAMTVVRERVQAILAVEGVEAMMDDIDLQITISRALLMNPGDEHLVIRVPVQHCRRSATVPAFHHGVSETQPPLTDEGSLLDGLFVIDADTYFREGGSHG